MPEMNKKESKKISKFYLESHSEAEAILDLIAYKNRYAKSSAINLALANLFTLLEGKGMSEHFLTMDAIIHLREGRTPSKTLHLLQKSEGIKHVKKEKTSGGSRTLHSSDIPSSHMENSSVTPNENVKSNEINSHKKENFFVTLQNRKRT